MTKSNDLQKLGNDTQKTGHSGKNVGGVYVRIVDVYDNVSDSSVTPALTDEFELLHISDLHFGEKDKPNRVNDQMNVLTNTFYKKCTSPPDGCVISGDICNQGGIGLSQEEQKTLLGNVSQSIWGDQDTGKERFVVVPGNHDTIQAKHPEHRDMKLFGNVVSDYFPNFIPSERMSENPFFASAVLYKCNGFSVIVCGFDSTLIESKQSAGLGYVSKSQMDAMKKALDKLEREAGGICIKIATLHHHLLPMYDTVVNLEDCKSDVKNGWLTRLKRIFLGGERQENSNNILEKLSITVDSFEFRYWLFDNDFCLVLHGHQHFSFLTEECQHFSRRDLRDHGKRIFFCAAGGATHATPEFDVQMSFSRIKITCIDVAIGLYSMPIHTEINLLAAKTFCHNSQRNLRLYVAKKVREIANCLAKSRGVTSGQRETFDFEIPLTDCMTINHLLVVFEALGVLERRKSSVLGIGEHQGQYVMPVSIAGNGAPKVKEGFLKNLSRVLGNEDGCAFPTNSGDTITNAHSLLRLSVAMVRNNLKLFEIAEFSGEYDFIAVFQSTGPNTGKILLAKHVSWRMYLLPTARKSDTDPYEQRFNRKAELLAKKDINLKSFLSPSHGGISKHRVTLFLYEVDYEVESLDVPALPLNWFTLGEIKEGKHMANDLPEKLFTDERSHRYFPTNCDIIEIAFKEYDDLKSR